MRTFYIFIIAVLLVSCSEQKTFKFGSSSYLTIHYEECEDGCFYHDIIIVKYGDYYSAVEAQANNFSAQSITETGIIDTLTEHDKKLIEQFVSGAQSKMKKCDEKMVVKQSLEVSDGVSKITIDNICDWNGAMTFEELRRQLKFRKGQMPDSTLFNKSTPL